MSTSTNLPQTRLFTSLDPYHRDVDNRPLQDLDDRDVRLAEAIDSEVSAKNVLALATGLLASGVLRPNMVVGSHPLTVDPLSLVVNGALLTQQVWDAGTSVYVPALGVDAKLQTFTFTTPAAGQQRPFTLAARVVTLSGTDTPWFDGALADTASFSKVGKIEWSLLVGADEVEGGLPTWPVPVSGWVPVFHVVTDSTTTFLNDNVHVFPVNFRQQGGFQPLLPWADSVGKVLRLGSRTGMAEVVDGTFDNGPDGPRPLVWDWPVPPPGAAGKVLTSTGPNPTDYSWEDAAAGPGSVFLQTAVGESFLYWKNETGGEVIALVEVWGGGDAGGAYITTPPGHPSINLPEAQAGKPSGVYVSDTFYSSLPVSSYVSRYQTSTTLSNLTIAEGGTGVEIHVIREEWHPGKRATEDRDYVWYGPNSPSTTIRKIGGLGGAAPIIGGEGDTQEWLFRDVSGTVTDLGIAHYPLDSTFAPGCGGAGEFNAKGGNSGHYALLAVKVPDQHFLYLYSGAGGTASFTSVGDPDHGEGGFSGGGGLARSIIFKSAAANGGYMSTA